MIIFLGLEEVCRITKNNQGSFQCKFRKAQIGVHVKQLSEQTGPAKRQTRGVRTAREAAAKLLFLTAGGVQRKAEEKENNGNG